MREGDVSQCLWCGCDVSWYYDNIKDFCGAHCEDRWREKVELKDQEEEHNNTDDDEERAVFGTTWQNPNLGESPRDLEFGPISSDEVVRLVTND